MLVLEEANGAARAEIGAVARKIKLRYLGFCFELIEEYLLQAIRNASFFGAVDDSNFHSFLLTYRSVHTDPFILPF